MRIAHFTLEFCPRYKCSDRINNNHSYRSRPYQGIRDFKGIFSRLATYDFPGWAVLEWECCLKHQEDGAREGAEFIREHIIRVTDKAFDDFADAGTDDAANKRILGLS